MVCMKAPDMPSPADTCWASRLSGGTDAAAPHTQDPCTSLGSTTGANCGPGGANGVPRSGGPTVEGAAGGASVDRTGWAEGGAQTHTHGRLSAATVGAVTAAGAEQPTARAINALP
jgi:hypothetical protein